MFRPGGPTFLELARQALSSTERGYDLLAPKFDLTPFRTPEPILTATARYLAEGRPAPAGDVLDLCCGTGAVLRSLAPVLEGRLVGLDFSGGMLEVARDRTASRGRIALVRADALRPPFAWAFDLVTCFSALGHFTPPTHRDLVRAVRGCLRPGGRFLFLTGRMPPKASAAYLVSRLFNAAMHVRNAVWSPSFTMYYLMFLWPEVGDLLREEGFEPQIVDDVFEAPFERLSLVDATLS